jgi:hypothetical protein
VPDEILTSVEVGVFSFGAASGGSKEVFVTVLEVSAEPPVVGCVSSVVGWFPRDQLDGVPGNDWNRLPTNELTSVDEESWRLSSVVFVVKADISVVSSAILVRVTPA